MNATAEPVATAKALAMPPVSRGRPKYRTSTGEIVPSVTTIISRFKDSGPLLYWANKVGREQGLTLDEARTPAATAGTMAHNLVEAHIHGVDLPSLDGAPDTIAKARRAFAAYLQWSKMSRLQILYTEVELVSDIYKFGGRLDAIGVIGDGDTLSLVDWKTSNSVYADYTLQLAAYQILWEENYPDHPLSGGFHLCRFAKEEGDYAHHHFPALDREGATFLAMRRLFDQVKEIEKRVK